VKLHRIRIPKVAVGALLLAATIGITAPPALATAASVTGNISGDPVAPGDPHAPLSFTISPSARTLASFTLTPPTGWKLQSVDSGPAVQSGNTISATGLSVTSSGSVTVGFTVGTGCVDGDSPAWTLVALDTQGRTYGNDGSDLITHVNGSCHLAVTTQPADAKAGQTITSTAFNSPAGDNVQVTLQNEANATVDYFQVTVGFDLKKNGVAASGLSPTTALTINGVATFTTLSVSVPNEALFSAYTLTPKSPPTGTATLTGDASTGFDIWGDACTSAGCHATLRNGNEDYTNNGLGHLSVSQLVGALAQVPGSTLPTGLICPGQSTIFANTVFESEADTAGGPVFLRSLVTRQDMKASANNGQAHVQWCVGLPAAVANGGTYVQRDTDGDGSLDLFVGFAPACPNMNPSASAPCITRQFGDGNGGSITEGWLPPDPPRRT
jgi:hypothetical protein